jgi:hypothetical protein
LAQELDAPDLEAARKGCQLDDAVEATLELETFIESTLVAIVRASLAAREKIEPLGSELNPPIAPNVETLKSLGKLTPGSPVTEVEFDVWVEAVDTLGGKVGGGAVLAVVGFGTHVSANEERKGGNRIRFKIPIAIGGTLRTSKAHADIIRGTGGADPSAKDTSAVALRQKDVE